MEMNIRAQGLESSSNTEQNLPCRGHTLHRALNSALECTNKEIRLVFCYSQLNVCIVDEH